MTIHPCWPLSPGKLALAFVSFSFNATFAALSLHGQPQSVPELLVVTDIEVRAAVEEVIEEFSRPSGAIIRPLWVDFRALPAAANEADILLWQEGSLRGSGLDVTARLESGTEKLIGRKHLAILTRQGNPPAITQLGDLSKRGLKVALASAEYTSLDRATTAALERAEMAAEILGNVRRRCADGTLLVAALREGKVDAALGWDALEGLAPSEIDAIPLPESSTVAVSIRAAVGSQSRHKGEARSFVDFLASTVGQAVFGHYGYRVELDLGGAEAYDTLVERRLKHTYPLTARRMINASGITGGVCLDIGCGSGWLEMALASISRLKIVGLDIDPEMVAIARRRIEGAGLSERVTFVVGDVHKMPFEDRSADLIVSRGSLPFWKDKVAALREIHRVLKPEGFALLGGRYLFTPARFLVSDEELRDVAAETGITNIRVVTHIGQWVEIRGPKWAAAHERKPVGASEKER